jgi:hypothetical protein
MDEGRVEAGGMEGVMSYEARICTLPHDKATALAQQRPSLAGTELRRAPKPATRETAKGLLCIGRHHTHLRQLDCQAASASLRLCVSACLPACTPPARRLVAQDVAARQIACRVARASSFGPHHMTWLCSRRGSNATRRRGP